MFNRTYQIRARRQKLQGQQLDITFPKRGRPTRIRVLEKCGQMRLGLDGQIYLTADAEKEQTPIRPLQRNNAETFDDALQMTFPVRPYTEDELFAEFERLFPAEV